MLRKKKKNGKGIIVQRSVIITPAITYNFNKLTANNPPHKTPNK